MISRLKITDLPLGGGPVTRRFLVILSGTGFLIIPCNMNGSLSDYVRLVTEAEYKSTCCKVIGAT